MMDGLVYIVKKTKTKYWQTILGKARAANVINPAERKHFPLCVVINTIHELCVMLVLKDNSICLSGGFPVREPIVQWSDSDYSEVGLWEQADPSSQLRASREEQKSKKKSILGKGTIQKEPREIAIETFNKQQNYWN